MAEPLDYILPAFNQYSVLTTQYNQVQPSTVYCNSEDSLNSVKSTQGLERGTPGGTGGLGGTRGTRLTRGLTGLAKLKG